MSKNGRHPVKGDMVEVAADSHGALYNTTEFKQEHFDDPTTQWITGRVDYVYSDGAFVVRDLEQQGHVVACSSLPSSWFVDSVIPPHIWRFPQPKKPAVVKHAGMRCIDCGEFYEYVEEPNHEKGLVCYPCRTTNSWKWAAGLIVTSTMNPSAASR